MTTDVLKMFHIAFAFDQPMPGVITIPAKDENDAKKLLMDMAKNVRNVEIHQIVDAATVESLQSFLEKVDADNAPPNNNEDEPQKLN